MSVDLKALQIIFPHRTAIRVREFCSAHGIGLTLFYALVKSGEIRISKIGRVTVVRLYE